MYNADNERLVEKQEIYIDCTKLLGCVHSAIYDMSKKDRVVIGDRLMDYALSMLSHFSTAWNFRDVRAEETDRFLFCYYEFRSLARMCTEKDFVKGKEKVRLKIISPKRYSAMAIYMTRIEEGIGKWRKSVRSRKENPASVESNNVHGSGNVRTRGDTGFI